jgi:cytochrome c oxidase cbb3-type subunit II
MWGKIGEAHNTEGAVFVIKTDEQKHPYIEDATVTKGWQPDAVIKAAGDENISHAGAGKTLFVREGCWWCHTLLPEQTQDWQVFGAPPMLGDFNGESPTAFGSDRKAPDLLHVGSRNSSREWMMLHFLQPEPRAAAFDHAALRLPLGRSRRRRQEDRLCEVGRGIRCLPRRQARSAAGRADLYAANSEARWLIDFVLNLK